jgi:hypothetical protein
VLGADLRIFKTKVFARFARGQRIRDGDLHEAVERADRGSIDADLGGGVIKQRLARKGQGRSGGFRLLLAFRGEDRAVFIHGFAKSERDNIDDKELRTLREIAAGLLKANIAQLEKEVAAGRLQEVRDGKKNEGTKPVDGSPA